MGDDGGARSIQPRRGADELWVGHADLRETSDDGTRATSQHRPTARACGEFQTGNSARSRVRFSRVASSLRLRSSGFPPVVGSRWTTAGACIPCCSASTILPELAEHDDPTRVPGLFPKGPSFSWTFGGGSDLVLCVQLEFKVALFASVC